MLLPLLLLLSMYYAKLQRTQNQIDWRNNEYVNVVDCVFVSVCPSVHPSVRLFICEKGTASSDDTSKFHVFSWPITCTYIHLNSMLASNRVLCNGNFSPLSHIFSPFKSCVAMSAQFAFRVRVADL